MDAPANTLFLRLEGPLQAWGDNSKFVIRRTMEAPTKSGVLGLVCCAMGIPRESARAHLPRLCELSMGVRIDRPAIPWWDYHTVGAGYGIRSADGKIKRTASTKEYETLVTRREYLADASFLVALRGDSSLVQEVVSALNHPRWCLFLGRKSCPPAAPVFAGYGVYQDLQQALLANVWQPRTASEANGEDGGFGSRKRLECLVEWRPTPEESTAPQDAEVWYDVPEGFSPPNHGPRFVVKREVLVPVGGPLWNPPGAPSRPQADYTNSEYRKQRKKRLEADFNLCVFCKSRAETVQHVTYRRAGGRETQEDLRSLCRLCHDAVTMIEYGLGMGLDRIDPVDICWRDKIREKRDELVKFRSLQARRRSLNEESRSQ